MRKYKLKPQYENILETILKNRDLTIEQANEILNPPEDCIQDPMDMKNMELAIDKLKYHIDNNSKIGTLVDVDVDGYCSSSMIYNLILNQLEYRNIIYILQNKNKAHGLEESVVEDIIKSEIDLLIIPDAGCTKNDGIQQKKLVELGIDIIILDHHIVECEDIEGAIIVNPNQYGDNTNKNLSGAGVTYKFVQAFCKKYYPDIDHTQYIDLFALSLISDMMDMRNLENRMYYNVGSAMEYIQNPLIIEYINNKKLEGDYLTIEQLGFSIAPYINSVIRLGNKQERELLFIAMADQRLVKSNKRGCFGQMALASEEAVRVSNNMKSKQDKQKKEGASKVLKRIEEQNLLDNKVIICDVTDILSPSLTGLAANTILNEIKRPLILLRTNDGEKYTGSARNYGDAIKDFKELCNDTKLFNFCSGHPGAFGVEITKDNLNIINKTFNELLCDVDFESTIEIDGLYENKVPMEDIQTVADCQDLWCHNIKEPQFLIKGIKIHTKDIQKVGIANYKFMYNGCYFVKNYGSKVWYENFSNPGNKLPFGGELNVEVLCRFRKTHTGFYYIDIIDTNSTI